MFQFLSHNIDLLLDCDAIGLFLLVAKLLLQDLLLLLVVALFQVLGLLEDILDGGLYGPHSLINHSYLLLVVF